CSSKRKKKVVKVLLVMLPLILSTENPSWKTKRSRKKRKSSAIELWHFSWHILSMSPYPAG
ncbi:hypothetical protein SB749_20850, partial [Brevibacterium sp. SIMBA_078]|uniref:hypothetical protein n=1 Tax=Brevibacterium sp. SIMBA_078 TaxID=3085816 RepID=UPI00397B01E2